ncbi:siderophore-interacting protein [Billgrantia pellis]|uniref:Siderophore-interacting protein n=1 Tax=Billgrantia pellis TaxID=2606936 RepID=A0A7V7G206_9GAMM|nr:siderophore-interacting protein [Halomonas pellis]KAA0012954.1 siderophore-interacting protein [Halomonas pellis]
MAGRSSYRLFDIALARRTQVSTSLVRLTFTGPEVSRMATYAPDQRIKLFFPPAGGSLETLFEIAKREEHDWYGAYRALPEEQRPPMRTYTIRALRPMRGEVEVEFVLHGDNGPASRWALRARPGDRLAMTAPAADAEGPAQGYEWKPPRDVRRVLIVADETALPAAAGILEGLASSPLRPKVEALIEVPLNADIQSLEHAAKLHWLPREAAPECRHGERLLRAMQDIDLSDEIRTLGGTSETADAPDEFDDERPFWEAATLDDTAPFYAWIAAESKVAMAIRRYLVNECGLPKRYVTSMGYWRQGKVSR